MEGAGTSSNETDQLPQHGPMGVIMRVGDALAFVLLVLGGFCLLASIVVVLLEIVYRYILRTPFVSSESILTVAFTWLIFLGIPRSVWRGKAARLGLTVWAPAAVRNTLLGIGDGATIAYSVLIVWSFLALYPSQVNTQIPSLGISEFWVGMAIAVGMGITALIVVCRRVQDGLSIKALVGVVLGILLVVILELLSVSPVTAGIIGILVLIAVDTPIAVALGVGGSAMVLEGGASANLSVPAGQILVPTENLALLAIPLFMFMGGIFAQSRLAVDLSRFVRQLLGWLPGGVGVACVGTAAIFANVSGSAIADTAAIGSVYIPQLVESGYPPEDAAALQASAGVVGVVFPPAIAMILYASVANVDLIPVFKAVIIPGLLLVAVMMAITVFHAWRTGIPRSHQTSWRAFAFSMVNAIPVLLIPFILDGGIFSGIFTPAESGAVAVLVSLILITTLRGFSLRRLGQAVEQALDNTALVMFILVSVSILDYGFVTSGVSADITQILGGIKSQWQLLLLINVIFIVIHEFVDAGPSILVVVPLIMPAALALGVNPFQLAAVIGINSTIGAVLPPIGINLYISSELANVEPRRVIGKILPYVAGSFVVLIVVTLVPKVSLWLTGS